MSSRSNFKLIHYPIPTRAVTSRGLSAAEYADSEEKTSHSPNAVEMLTELAQLLGDPQIGNDRWTLAEDTYGKKMRAQALNTVRGLTELRTLMGASQIHDYEWSLGVGAHIIIVNVSYQEVAKLQPPAKFKEVHSKCYAGFVLYNEAMKNLAYAIDNNSQQRANLSIKQIVEGSKLIEQATAMLRRMQ